MTWTLERILLSFPSVITLGEERGWHGAAAFVESGSEERSFLQLFILEASVESPRFLTGVLRGVLV